MHISPVDFRSHFREYECKLYQLPTELNHSITADEIVLLNEYGLPDRALPFFYFDLHLHLVRDYKLPGCKLILGSGLYPGSEDYIYLHENGTIVYKELAHPITYVNGSVEQLLESIYVYSHWLQDLEILGETTQNYEVSEEDIFDIYYDLRRIDKKALQGYHIWNCIIQFDTPKREFLTSSSL